MKDLTKWTHAIIEPYLITLNSEIILLFKDDDIIYKGYLELFDDSESLKKEGKCYFIEERNAKVFKDEWATTGVANVNHSTIIDLTKLNRIVRAELGEIKQELKF